LEVEQRLSKAGTNIIIVPKSVEMVCTGNQAKFAVSYGVVPSIENTGLKAFLGA